MYIAIPLIGYIITLILFATISGESDFSAIFMGFLPLLFYAITAMYLINQKRIQEYTIWIVPLLYLLAFYVAWMIGNFPGMDVPSLIIWQIIIIVILNSILFIQNPFPQLKTHIQQKQQHNQQLHQKQQQIQALQAKLAQHQISEKNLTLNLRSIEDKCKGINFVIGRVYADKKGGNENIRKLLHIPRDLYNRFSEISNDPRHRREILDIIRRVYEKLLLYDMPENRLFTISSQSELERDQNGNDRIVDVLGKNDNDPVIEYIDETKQICTRLIEFLER